MTLKTSKTVEHEINIPVPCFWNLSHSYIGVVDEATVIKFFISDDYFSIQHGTPDFMKSDLTTAQLEYDLCTESEWLDKYAVVLKSISLTPELINP